MEKKEKLCKICPLSFPLGYACIEEGCALWDTDHRRCGLVV